MKTKSLLMVLILSVSLMATPSPACRGPMPWVIPWSITAIFAGLGAMFIVFEVRANGAYAATFSPSTLVVTGFEPLNQGCQSCFNNAASSCTTFPWGATYLASYPVLSGNRTLTFNTTGLSMMDSGETGTFLCGNSAQEALANIAGFVNIGSTRSMWYENRNPSTWTFFVINPNGNWIAGIAVSAVVFVISGALGGFMFCFWASSAA